MTGSFHASVTILLVVAVTLLAFVTAHLLTRLIKLEARVLEGGRELFGSLRGQRVSPSWVEGAPGLTRVLMLTEDCARCRVVAGQAADGDASHQAVTLVWRGDGLDLGATRPLVRIVTHAQDDFERLGVRVTPLELWANPQGEIVVARPAGASARSSPFPEGAAHGANGGRYAASTR